MGRMERGMFRQKLKSFFEKTPVIHYIKQHGAVVRQRWLPLLIRAVFAQSFRGVWLYVLQRGGGVWRLLPWAHCVYFTSRTPAYCGASCGYSPAYEPGRTVYCQGISASEGAGADVGGVC